MGGVAWMAALLLLRLEWAVGRGKGWRRWLGLCRKCKRRGVGRERRGRAMRCGERGWMWQGVRVWVRGVWSWRGVQWRWGWVAVRRRRGRLRRRWRVSVCGIERGWLCLMG